MQTIKYAISLPVLKTFICWRSLVLTALIILFPLNAIVSADTIDVSNNDCASPGSSQTESSLGHFNVGIVSVSGNLGDWDKNSCLRSEISHFDKYALYVDTNYPSAGCHTGTTRTDAYNCGYSLGLFDVGYAASQGAHSNVWWLDVEQPGVQFASTYSKNSVFLYGLSSALQTRGVTDLGYYSTSLQWDGITGGWHSGNNAWYATGEHGSPPSSIINNDCHNDFTGGPVVYYQYIVGSTQSGLDYDGNC